MKPKGKVKIIWSPQFAYAIGLLTTDGNLSKDGRHLELTSKDKQQLTTFMKCLGIKVKIGYKISGYTGKRTTHIQFGDVSFYNFLLSIGLMPNKTKILSALNIPDKYFFDFLRGHFDGDGSSYSYWDPRWRSSFMFYLIFVSASKKHIEWLRQNIFRLLKIKGHVSHSANSTVYQLRYAKRDSLIVYKKLYYSEDVVCLKRKFLKIQRALSIINKHNARVAKLETALP